MSEDKNEHIVDKINRLLQYHPDLAFMGLLIAFGILGLIALVIGMITGAIHQ